MKLNITQKCQIIGIGTLFLLAITAVEITLFLSIFNIDVFSGKGFAVIATAIIFNISIWAFATKYQTTKEYLERKENERTDQ